MQEYCSGMEEVVVQLVVWLVTSSPPWEKILLPVREVYC